MSGTIIAGNKGNYAEVDNNGRLKVQTDAELTLTSIETEIQGTLDVSFVGNIVEEVKTDADAVLDVITFASNINAIEVWHNENTAQSFVVNGITLVIGPGGWRSPIGGTPAATVDVPSGISCVVARLI